MFVEAQRMSAKVDGQNLGGGASCWDSNGFNFHWDCWQATSRAGATSPLRPRSLDSIARGTPRLESARLYASHDMFASVLLI
jgi:hypothetical protein